MAIGDRIKQRRIDLELTADDLAERVGKSRATIYRYENGDIENMPTTVLEPLADALYTTPAYLMGWTDDPHDWEQIGNEEGIYPPKDYEGSYEDYVKYKILETQNTFIDNCCTPSFIEDINSNQDDPDIRRIQRARNNMDQKSRDKMMKILEASFEEYFGDDYIDEDKD